MSGRRTQRCGTREAIARLRDAQAHLDLAAAADAACCMTLRERSRSQDHRDATRLVHNVTPGGPTAAKHLTRLLDVKDTSQYGFEDLTGHRLTATLRQTRALVAWAEEIVRR